MTTNNAYRWNSMTKQLFVCRYRTQYNFSESDRQSVAQSSVQEWIDVTPLSDTWIFGSLKDFALTSAKSAGVHLLPLGLSAPCIPALLLIQGREPASQALGHTPPKPRTCDFDWCVQNGRLRPLPGKAESSGEPGQPPKINCLRSWVNSSCILWR